MPEQTATPASVASVKTVTVWPPGYYEPDPAGGLDELGLPKRRYVPSNPCTIFLEKFTGLHLSGPPPNPKDWKP